ncbi:Serine/threonine-protein kinase tel1 [Zalaria obscura]|uniref:Serine/threonine-protein kinase tel1 n=1 Tax=Zalaria obscura TaxID=2024903 RepID=A0ACC3SN47_9PEZI
MEEVNVANALERLDASTIRERDEALADLKHILSYNQRNPRKAVLKDSAFHKIFETIFRVASTERSNYLRSQSNVSKTVRSASSLRLSSCAAALRIAVEFGVRNIKVKTLKALIDHILESLPDARGEFCEPLALDYTKCLNEIFAYQPHVEHLPLELWEQVCTFCLEALGARTNDSEEDAALGASVAASYSSSKGDNLRSSRSNAKLPRTSQVGRPLQKNIAEELVSCLRHLTEAPSAPLLPCSHQILSVMINYLSDVHSPGKSVQDAVAVIHQTLARTTTEAVQTTLSLTEKLLRVTRALWPLRSGAVKDELLVLLVLLKPYIRHSVRALDLDVVRAEAGALLEAMHNEYTKRTGKEREVLHLEDLSLRFANAAIQSGLNCQVFALRNGNPRSENAWATLRMIAFLHSLQEHRSSEEDGQAVELEPSRSRKRQRLQHWIDDTLRSCNDSQASTRVCALQCISMSAQITRLDENSMLRVLDELSLRTADDGGLVSSWAFMALASVQIAERSLLVDAIDAIASSIEFNGPSLFCDSVSALLGTVITYARLERTMASNDVSERVLTWLFRRWSPSKDPFMPWIIHLAHRAAGNITERASAAHNAQIQTIDVLDLVNVCIGIQPHIPMEQPFPIWGAVAQSFIVAAESQGLVQYLLLEQENEMLLFTEVSKPDHVDRSEVHMLPNATICSMVVAMCTSEVSRSIDQWQQCMSQRLNSITTDVIRVLCTLINVAECLTGGPVARNASRVDKLRSNSATLLDLVSSHLMVAIHEHGHVDAALDVFVRHPLSDLAEASQRGLHPCHCTISLCAQLSRALETRQHTQQESLGQDDDLEELEPAFETERSQGHLPGGHDAGLRRDVPSSTDISSRRAGAATYAKLLRILAGAKEAPSSSSTTSALFCQSIIALPTSHILAARAVVAHLPGLGFNMETDDIDRLLAFLADELLSSYEYERSEVATGLVLDFLSSVANDIGHSSAGALYELGIDMYKWYTVTALAANILSNNAQRRLSAFMLRLLQINPDYGTTDALPTPRQLSKTLAFGSPREVFTLFSPQLLYTWLESHSLQDLPYSVFGYEELGDLLKQNAMELFAQLLVRGQDKEVTWLSVTTGISKEDLLHRSFAKSLAYAISWDICMPSSSGTKNACESSLRSLLATKEEYRDLAIRHFPKTLAQMLVSMQSNDEAVDRALEKRPAHAKIVTALREMRAFSSSSRSLPETQQPSFKGKFFVDQLERLSKRAGKEVHNAIDTAAFTIVARSLLNDMHPALGPLHVCQVVRQLRLLVAISGDTALAGYPLEMLIHGLGPLAVDSQCADDAIGVLQFLYQHGKPYLTTDMPAMAGQALLTMLSIKTFLNSKRDQTTQESQYQATVARLKAFHDTLFSQLSDCQQSVPDRSRSRYLSIVQSCHDMNLPATADHGHPAAVLLRELLDDAERSQQLVDEIRRKKMMTLLRQQFKGPLSSAEDLFGSDELSVRYALQIWEATHGASPSEHSEWVAWAAGVLGRAYSSTGSLELVHQIKRATSRVTFRDNKSSVAAPSKTAIVTKLRNLLMSENRRHVGVSENTIRSIANRFPEAKEAVEFEQLLPSHIVVALSEPDTIEQLLERVEHEKDGLKGLMLHSAHMDASMRSAGATGPSEFQGVIGSLGVMNLSSLTHSLLSSKIAVSEYGTMSDTMLEAARKLEQWDIATPETQGSATATLYGALQGLREAQSIQKLKQQVDGALCDTLLRMRDPRSGAASVRSTMSALAVLTEIKEVASIQSQSHLTALWHRMETRQRGWDIGRSNDAQQMMSFRETIFSTLTRNKSLRDGLHLNLRDCRLVEVQALANSSSFARKHDLIQQSLTAATYLNELVPLCREIGLEIEAAAQLEVASILWKQDEVASSVQMLQDLCFKTDLGGQSVAIGRAGILAQLVSTSSITRYQSTDRTQGSQTATARLEKPEDVIAKYLKPAIAQLKTTSKGSEAGRVFHEFASFCDEQLQNPGNLEDYNRLAKLRQSKVDEIRGLDALLKATTDKAEKQRILRDRTKAKQWYDLDDQEFRRASKSRDEFVQQSLQNYLRALQASDEHDASVEARVKVYRAITEKYAPVLRYFFLERFEDPDEWFERRLAYTRSTATFSMLGHILGLGDRHCHNILLDEKSGEVIHIDLGVAFEAGRVLPVPEVVPFRLTRDIVDGMGITKTEGVFRRCCEFTMEALREDRDSIMTLLNVLRYDPLYNWTVSPLRAKRMQEAQEGALVEPDKPEAGSKRREYDAGEAGRALSIVEKKLSKTLSTAATVNELIQQATDERNLAVLFAGWAAYN